MKKSIDFISQHISEWLQLYPQISVQYEFETQDRSHFIEIKPFFVAKQTHFKEIVKQCRVKFYELFPNEELVFLKENSIYQIENPTFVLQGADYQDVRPAAEELLEIDNQNFDYESINKLNLVSAA